MTTLDTDVLARLILLDDAEQVARVRALVSAALCYVPDSVLLELA